MGGLAGRQRCLGAGWETEPLQEVGFRLADAGREAICSCTRLFCLEVRGCGCTWTCATPLQLLGGSSRLQLSTQVVDVLGAKRPRVLWCQTLKRPAPPEPWPHTLRLRYIPGCARSILRDEQNPARSPGQSEESALIGGTFGGGVSAFQSFPKVNCCSPAATSWSIRSHCLPVLKFFWGGFSFQSRAWCPGH